MATRKLKTDTTDGTPAKSTGASAKIDLAFSAGSVASTVSGPSADAPKLSKAGKAASTFPELTDKVVSAKELSAKMPANSDKAAEYGDAARVAHVGSTQEPANAAVTGSTVSESNLSEKLGDGEVAVGNNATIGPLDRVRADGGGRPLTTNQGVLIADNQNSLKIGLRGPTALEDFILREKITHFDHERIPERVVHARGSAAHGFFESYANHSKLTKAAPFQQKGKQTPVFVRFSTVAGERGSADAVRDVRGFAVKFYTDQGNWDLVGNNMPVFFIQDAMKFPDLVHAVKPEPHFAMPQASSAHDTFWDFVSLTPESTHMLLWQMSDRAIPRSYRMMQGFGVHTFRLVNEAGESVFCKFHWTPKAGVHSLVWDEAVKINGADSDFHRRDLWEAIEAGAYPEWELGVQVFSEEQADNFPFDVLDPTKVVPEELIPITPIGRMVLNRNPDNFFAETEQVAFCTAHIIPGIDFSNDPLLQGRIHSYLDTQLTRLGGPNFHEIPINAPIVQVHNNQRDGMHRQAVHRGRVAYEPNSMAGGCPFQAGKSGFVSFPERIAEDKVRGKPELFADHFSQARLFYKSQSMIEQQHIANAFTFELSRVQTPAIRERVVSLLVNVDSALGQKVADGLALTLPSAAPVLMEDTPEYSASPALSMKHYPGDGTLAGRKVAILVADNVDHAYVSTVYKSVLDAGGVPRLLGKRLGSVTAGNGEVLNIEAPLEATPAVLYDAVVVPNGEGLGATLSASQKARMFLKEQYEHGKPILVGADTAEFLEAAGVPMNLPDGNPDPGIFLDTPDPDGSANDAIELFIGGVAGPRICERETEPLAP
ncbi:catalase [Undibacterium sp. TJN25]|uniref:catalase n=1 Tax=Undibacterium sp. TJN25 TaxID=3413056 RepID=UPI003BF0E8B2